MTFPSDFGTDFQLINVSGTSFLKPQGSSSINILEKDLENRTFMFQACQNTWGANPTGALIFEKVRNPEYIKETGSFEITVASDYDFNEIIAIKTSDLVITED